MPQNSDIGRVEIMETRVTRLLGIKYPIIQGGMAWVANAELAANVSKAGGFGFIGAANAPAEWVRGEIEKARQITDKPFGVNVMLLSEHADEVAQVVAEEKVSAIAAAVYEVPMPLSSAPALEAYNAAPAAEVTKKTKRGQKALDLKAYLPRLDWQAEGEQLHFTVQLPCGSGEALNLNPALLMQYLQGLGGAPAWQCQVLRTHLYDQTGRDFA